VRGMHKGGEEGERGEGRAIEEEDEKRR